ncbi:MAG TPA: NEW3 domain-containing protein, partial [Candidatus Limnocylindrales bacterium]|nr:NEW3 domain-containing protein [Candidatus Limnocylindrales bacterium]
MSDRVSRHPGRPRLAVRAALLLASLGLIAGPLAPLAAAAGEITLSTPFPSIVAEPGSTAAFKLTIGATADGEVTLKADAVPTGWAARFAGGGLTIDSAFVTADKPVEVTFNVDIPADAAAGSTTIRVSASDGGAVILPLTIRVADAAAGDLTLTSDFPELRGPSSSTFTFNLTLTNGTAAEETFALDAQGAPGWTVSAKPSGQAQATSTVVAAGSTATITVTAEPPAEVEAASYPVLVT